MPPWLEPIADWFTSLGVEISHFFTSLLAAIWYFLTWLFIMVLKVVGYTYLSLVILAILIHYIVPALNKGYHGYHGNRKERLADEAWRRSCGMEVEPGIWAII